jgi:ketosteroid isomerase-like protein
LPSVSDEYRIGERTDANLSSSWCNDALSTSYSPGGSCPNIRAFVAAYEDALNRHDPEGLSALYREDADIIMMADDVALLNVIGTRATLEATDQLVPTRETRATWVLRREDGKWLIAALRVLPSENDRVIRVSGR